MKNIDCLNKIINDNISGSVEILQKINEYLKKNYSDTELIKKSLITIKSKLTGFEAVTNYINELDKIISCGNELAVKNFLEEFNARSKDIFYKIYLNLKPLITNKHNIFTLSNSQTVFEIIKCLRKDNAKIAVTVAESRPMLEGRILAKKILRLGIKVRYVMDCQIASEISKCDILLLGADMFLNNKDAVNKIGSKNAAIIAAYYSKPVYIVASENKFSKKKKFIEEPKNSDEIWRFKEKNLTVENFYFEVVPRKLINKIITEKRTY